MGYQAVFERYELKYLLTKEQKKALLSLMEGHMKLDRYGRTTIRNLYFDTDDYRLIRHSIEKPVYKEKLRVRSYCRAGMDDLIFVELKKKYQSVVYKRRVVMPQRKAMDWLCRKADHPEQSQITDEIDYFCAFYRNLQPKVFLSYEREAYYSLDGSDFRMTIDENILSRQQEISLDSKAWGIPLLDTDLSLLEVKTSGGIPLWLTAFLTEQGIHKTSFSKYGTAYLDQILVLNQGDYRYVERFV